MSVHARTRILKPLTGAGDSASRASLSAFGRRSGRQNRLGESRPAASTVAPLPPFGKKSHDRQVGDRTRRRARQLAVAYRIRSMGPIAVDRLAVHH